MPEQKWLDLADQIEILIPKSPESGFGYLKTIVSSLRVAVPIVKKLTRKYGSKSAGFAP